MEWESTASSSNGITNGNSNTTGLRRRNNTAGFSNNNNDFNEFSSKKLRKKVVQNLDIFPKVERDLTIRTQSGNKLTYAAYIVTVLIILAEIYNYRSINGRFLESAVVDKSLGKQMRVDFNITFPALHCEDVHLDIMDVAGDAHNDVEDTIRKQRLHITDGLPLDAHEIEMEVNKAHAKELAVREALDKSLAPNYCGPCYGAADINECCNHCDDVIQKYKDMDWEIDQVKILAEQCIREGKTLPKRMLGGEGCNIAGYMQFNRVNGNFHIAMGEGIERNGQHIHTFIPDDVGNFNASHTIHELRFGPVYDTGSKSSSQVKGEQTTLEGVTKIVTEENGVSGMFQYFIKIVPTTYKGKNLVKAIDPTYDFRSSKEVEPQLETNRYFTTERFTPLMLDISDEHWELGELIKNNNQGGSTGGNTNIDRITNLKDDDGYYDDDESGVHHHHKKGDGVDGDAAIEEDIAGAKVGGNSGTSHSHHENHRQQQAVLPGLFFIYQVYPFVVEITKESIPFTHLLIRILSTVGGVFTIMGMIDAVLSSNRK